MEEKVMLVHGGGGKQTSELIHEVFAKRFRNLYLTEDDAAILPPPASNIAFTTDGFIVSPWKFPEGTSESSASAVRSMISPAWEHVRNICPVLL